MTQKLNPARNEYDMEKWLQLSHSDSFYEKDRIDLLENTLKEWNENGIWICGKYYPGVWTVDWSGYY